MTKFEVGKKYKNKNPKYGVAFKILAVGPEHILCTQGDSSRSIIWTTFREREEDFEEVVEPKTGTLWLNVQGPDSNWDHGLYYTRKDADKYAMPGRIACIEVPWTEGQGL